MNNKKWILSQQSFITPKGTPTVVHSRTLIHQQHLDTSAGTTCLLVCIKASIVVCLVPMYILYSFMG